MTTIVLQSLNGRREIDARSVSKVQVNQDEVLSCTPDELAQLELIQQGADLLIKHDDGSQVILASYLARPTVTLDIAGIGQVDISTVQPNIKPAAGAAHATNGSGGSVVDGNAFAGTLGSEDGVGVGDANSRDYRRSTQLDIDERDDLLSLLGQQAFPPPLGPDNQPNANPDQVETRPGQTISIDVLANDTGLEDGGIRIEITNEPEHGTLTIDPDTNELIYTADSEFVGEDQFTYTVIDADGDSDSAVVTINVLPPIDDNTDPTAVNDIVNLVITDGDTVIDVLANDSDVDGDTLQITTFTQPDNGSVVLNDDGTFTYTPVAFAGNAPNTDNSYTDTFTYTVSDGNGGTSTATVTVQVTDNLPSAVDDSGIQTDENVPVTIDVLANDTGLGDGGIQVIVTNGAHGSVTVDPNTQQVIYTPDEGYFGEDTFTYIVVDADGDSSSATVTVQVNDVDHQPVAVDDPNIQTDENQPVVIDVLANDTGLEDGGISVFATNGNNGTVSVDPVTQQVTYTPDAGFFGEDSFTYIVTDADGDSSSATVTVKVNDIDHQPVAVDDQNIQTDESQPVVIDVLANDSGLEDGGIKVFATNGNNGTVSVDPITQAVTYIPDTGFFGQDSFTYIVSDADGDSDSATVFVNVAEVDYKPVAVNDPDAQTPFEQPLVIDVLDNDLGLEDGGIRLFAVHGNNGKVSVDHQNQNLLYTPDAGFVGQDQFTYIVVDGDGDSSNAVVSVNVAPMAAPIVALAAQIHDPFQADSALAANQVIGTDAAEHLSGTTAADYVDGQLGADNLDGGAGDDVIVYDPQDGAIQGGEGRDTLLAHWDQGSIQSLLQSHIEGMEKITVAIDSTATGEQHYLVDALGIDQLTIAAESNAVVQSGITPDSALAYFEFSSGAVLYTDSVETFI